jgi:predicted nucleic acid-binding protein
MIAYLDTSSLVKLYVEEESSGDVANIVGKSRAAATSMIAYAEARAAFARRLRERAFTKEAYKNLISFFEKDWNKMLQVKVTKELIHRAGTLAEKHGLRGFDAIHLSSALTLKSKVNSPVLFSCYDEKLQKASLLERLTQP